MSEYWKSNPRKFCDFCKCWIADNKPSVEFHERGKRHKENVQVRLAEMGRKGQEEYEAKQQEGDFLKAMEEAALKAYKSDIEANPDLTGTKINEIAAASNAEIVVGNKKTIEDTKTSDAPVIKNWYEAQSPEGYTYYWNTETGESKWEVPEEGFLSTSEQEKLNKKNTKDSNSHTKNSISKKESPAAKVSSSKSTSVSSQPVTYGPAKKAEAYSSWQQVQTEPQQPAVDYQLPQIVEEGYYGPEVSIRKQEVSFREKTVTLSSSDRESLGNIGFKKRKAAQDNKKSMRRRNNDL
ncbi:WW domain-binding protein 4-like [Homarus americanus]|uniref:WW domain-binding protein 4-like n=1 Tax=Homarus americanus TaxID=6706 RepID=A0A8J5N3D2_HOMAM|nr:WW domain-binding protein 4-like [Homarus americanus]